jgi:O-antigen ligase
MMTAGEKQIAFCGGTIMCAAVMLAAGLSQPAWLLAPLAVLVVPLLMQKPVLLFYLLMLAIPWSVEYQFSSGFGTDLPDEPLMLLTAASAVFLVAKEKQASSPYSWHPLLVLLLLQLTWTVVSVINSTHLFLSLKYLAAKSWYLLAFVAAPLLLLKSKPVFAKAIMLLLASMLVVMVVSLIRHAALGFSFGAVNDAVAPFFRNHVNYSALLVFTVPVQLFVLSQTRSKRLRFFYLACLLLSFLALYFSFARGAWLALATGLAGYLLLRKRWLLPAFVIGVVAVAASFLWLRQDNRYVAFSHDYQTTVFHEDFGEHLAATYQLKDMSAAERFYRWIAAVRMTPDSWQTGFGPSTFYQHYKSYTVPAFKTWVSRNEEQSTVHNYFLLLLVEQGVMGLLLFLGLLGGMFWYAQTIYHRSTKTFWRGAVAVVAAILTMQITLNFLSDLIETDKVGSVFYLCIAALIVADLKTRQPRDEISDQRKIN